MSQNELDGKCQKFLDDLFAGLSRSTVGLAVELQKAEADLYGFRVAEAQRLADFIRTLAPLADEMADFNHAVAKIGDMQWQNRRLMLAGPAPKRAPFWFTHTPAPGNPGECPVPANLPDEDEFQKLDLMENPSEEQWARLAVIREKRNEEHNRQWKEQVPLREEWGKKKKAWTEADNMARLVQWRLAYADALLAALNPQPATVEAQP